MAETAAGGQSKERIGGIRNRNRCQSGTIAAVLRLTGFTREDRFSITGRLREALTSAGGWIVDHHQFSNLALAINFEIEAHDVPRLAAALEATGLHLSPDSQAALASFAPGGDTVMGSLQAVFVHEEKDVRVRGPLLG